MRVLSILVAAIAVATPVESFACSCMGTQSIGEAFANAEAVVVGSVIRRDPANYDLMNLAREPIVVRIIASLKGELKGDIRISTDIMCYRSFNLRDFEVGESYVFPVESFSSANRTGWLTPGEMSSNVSLEKLTAGLYLLPSCSHTGLALRDGNLYTNELTASGGRQLDYYMSLSLLKVLLPLGLLSAWRMVLVVLFFTLLPIAVLLIRKKAWKKLDPA